jgi:plasmid stabilization system protein ParE
MTVRFSRRALSQLDEILATIEADNPRAARDFSQRVETLAALLARHPTLGRQTSVARVRVFSTRPYP